MIVTLKAGYHCGHKCSYGKNGQCPVFGFTPSPAVSKIKFNTDHPEHFKRAELCDKYLAACCAAVEDLEVAHARFPKHR